MTLSRRYFCGAVGASIAASNLTLLADDQSPKPLRVVAYNIYNLKGWPSQSPLAQQAVARGQMVKRLAMEVALYDPDIINFSESPSEKLTKEVAELLGMNHVRFPSGGNWPGTLLSKTKISDPQNVPMNGERPKELFSRHWGRALVELPNNEPLIVHSAHLYPTPEPTIRLKEIRAMIESMKSDLDSGRSMLLIGDLNHSPDTDEYKLWIDAGWIDTFAKVGEGNGFTIKADNPEWRIDYVFATGPIAKRVSESRPLFEGAFRVNNEDEKSYALSDHLPQFAVFD
ncbi:secreted protein containing Endonuclease/exonuclease/phosphatase domain protein [Rhodopirellula baltica SH28]|uniref:Secreted protein containing Endonuclease/exonuclease/phosphatase domain protein n=1 Tax=Rhodopirellula baltica SH28 TaxID=993517 RepID=K5D9H0_RHOBT|nr:endonuclease/exonuclease/phosphatase family protein [Rhodopirellula baltica]EKJ99448.1 secreted protein containing Endonuclease/exonuclease/phosphatase domain protein [Rhodopirellula baltica SH28]